MSGTDAMVQRGQSYVVDPFEQYTLNAPQSQYDPSRAAAVHNNVTGDAATGQDFATNAPMGDYNFHVGNAAYSQSRQHLLPNSESHLQSDPFLTREENSDAAMRNGTLGGTTVNSATRDQPYGRALDLNEKPPKKHHSSKFKWLMALLAAIIAIIIILAAVLGGVLGSRANDDDDDKNNQSVPRSKIGSGNVQTNVVGAFPQNVFDDASKAASQGNTDPLSYRATDPYGNPMFIAESNTAVPSFGDPAGKCGKDPWKASNNLNNGRPGHPRLIAPKHMWDCLEDRIHNDAYLTAWNYTIMQNATNYVDEDPVKYDVDGGLTLSGILDVSRIVQQRIKAWAYAWRMTHDKKFSDRAYKEMQVAAGNTSQPFGDGDKRWNPDHFLDTAEMASAYAFAYDWMYDAWNDQQKSYIIDWIVRFGLAQGLDMYNKGSAWWSQSSSGNGNWNCVCNGGLVFSALAIQNDVQGDQKSTTDQILSKALDNAKNNCMRAVYEDGTWSETPNYWYFGTNAQARMVSALITATGSDQGLMDQNKNWAKTSEFHMYVTGNAGMFAYGDNGPNKFSTTANQLFLYSQLAKQPIYALFQRDRADAASDPLSMFWYDSTPRGGFFNGLPLDRFFDNDQGSWVSMRSTWTDMSGNYVAMKASNMTGHQTHGDLDAGDFVIDSLGTRFVGEYGSDNYLAKDYFASEEDGATRWKYFRKGTQGQNTLVIGKQNQNSSCKPNIKFESSNTKQNGDLGFTPGGDSTVYTVADLSSCYGKQDNGAVQRGIRFVNGRRQVLVQDEVKKQDKEIQWRVQTNATVTLSDDKKTATLEINKVIDPNASIKQFTANIPPVKMKATILSPDNAQFEAGPAYDKKSKMPNYYYGADAIPKQGTDDNGHAINPEVPDLEVTVLSITLPGDVDTNIQVWWQPEYAEAIDADKNPPKSVALSDWSLTSH